jgi:hypothetical protein
MMKVVRYGIKIQDLNQNSFNSLPKQRIRQPNAQQLFEGNSKSGKPAVEFAWRFDIIIRKFGQSTSLTSNWL